jgi:predicted phosphodiesterase
MTTAVLADLHLGGQMTTLATPPVLDRLLRELEGVDEVVLLGDALSLRDAALAEVLSASRGFFEGLGEVVGDGRIVLVPGNHDHRLAEPLLEQRLLDAGGNVLDARYEPRAEEAGPLGALAEWTGRADFVISYPGVWLRPDVYATHGHYLDCHLTVPRPESIAARAMAALLGLPDGRLVPRDYEAVLAPMYAFAYSVAQSSADPFARHGAAARLARGVRALAWHRLAGSSGRNRIPRRLAGALTVLAGTAALRAAGLGPFGSALDPAEIGRAGREAMAQVVARLEIEARYVIFGHTHHAAPLGKDTGERLINPGSWVYQPLLIGDAGSSDPFWPGRYVLVEADGPPRLRSALATPSAVRA